MNRRRARVTSRLLDRRAAALKRHLNGAIEGNPRDVHQSRVASRRLREAVPVLVAGLKGTKANKARGKIRRLTRALGTVRELDVTLQILDELVSRNTLPRQALEDVRLHVSTERDERRAVMLKRLGQVKIDKLDRRLESVGDALDQSVSEAWRDALGSRLLKRSKALKAAMGEAGHIYAPDRLHRVRIAAKKLRYALELAADAAIKTASAPVRAAKRAQETLGRLHDLQVLQSHATAVQAAPAAGSMPSAGLDIIVRALEDECRHLHARYVATVPQLTAVVETVRAEVVPQLARPASRARALKMTLKARPAGRRPAAAGRR
jgi:CHAD domain-containing protein